MGNYLVYDPPTTNDLAAYVAAVVLSSILSDLSTVAEKEAAVNKAIDAAESEVDSYLATKYEVPLTSPPDLIKDITAALTAEALYQRGTSLPESVAERAATKRRILRDLSSGAAALDTATPVEVSSTAGYLMVASEDILFTRDDLDFM